MRNKNLPDNMRASAQVDDGQWTKHDKQRGGQQWVRYLDSNTPYRTRLDYWPSTNRYRLDDLEDQSETKDGAVAFLLSLGIKAPAKTRKKRNAL